MNYGGTIEGDSALLAMILMRPLRGCCLQAFFTRNLNVNCKSATIRPVRPQTPNPFAEFRVLRDVSYAVVFT